MERTLRINIKLTSSMLHSISKGLIFCTTSNINKLSHDIFETILGNHAVKGAMSEDEEDLKSIGSFKKS